MSAPSFAGGWSKLKPALSPWIMQTVRDMGFNEMTPVQASVIPLFMEHKDVVVEAITGSGKTLAFVIPILEKLTRRDIPLRGSEIGAIVISPTRELAIQICKVIEHFIEGREEEEEQDRQDNSEDEEDENESTGKTRNNPINKPLLLVGGNSLQTDIAKFNETHPQILVGTPGRLEEFLLGSSSMSKGGSSKKSLLSRPIGNVKNLEMLVLDEADRLLDLGFAATVNRIFDHLPKQRRTGLFSATMTDSLGEVVRAGLRNPVKVVVKVQNKQNKRLVQEDRTPLTLRNTYFMTRAEDKLNNLIRILHHEKDNSTTGIRKFIVYFATCACVDYFYKVLSKMKVFKHIYSLHGQMSPTRRANTFSEFVGLSANETGILLCTDVAARGIDLPDVDCVVQFDPPVDTRAFGHRVGRTARAGKSGLAIVLLCEGEENYIEFLKIRKMPLIDVTQEYPALNPEEVRLQNEKLRSTILSDRDLHDLSVKAFVSLVRSYSKHEASFIFQLKNFDFVGAAKVYGLLKLPRMPELRDVDVRGWKDADINWDKYAYDDPQKEKQRKKQLAEGRIKKELVAKKKGTAWSHKEDEKEKREEKREKRIKKAKRAIEKSTDDATQEEDTQEDWKTLIKERKKKRKGGDNSGFDEAQAEFMSGLV